MERCIVVGLKQGCIQCFLLYFMTDKVMFSHTFVNVNICTRYETVKKQVSSNIRIFLNLTILREGQQLKNNYQTHVTHFPIFSMFCSEI